MDLGDTMTPEEFYGGSADITVDVNPFNVPPNYKRVLYISGGVAPSPLQIQLPNATKLRLGGPRHYIVNESGILIQVKDNDGTNLFQISDGVTVRLLLVENDDAAGLWAWRGALHAVAT